MSKKQNKSKKQPSSVSKSKLVKIFLLIFLFAFITSGLSYFIMKHEPSDKNSNKNINGILKQEKKQNEKFEEITDELKKDYLDNHEIKPEIKKIKLEEKPSAKKEVEKKKEEIILVKDKPKLVVIIDDVSNNRQKKAILDIGYDVTMAFLPPQEGHLQSAKIAQDLPVYMVHFPMQASPKFKSKEKITLNINNTYQEIDAIVKKLREEYPKAKYTNNHTGSVFTQNDEAMDRLFKALKKYDFVFVDSRTTAKSVAQKYAQKYDMPYIVRNTFLDNEKSFEYIQNQLKKAIKIANKRGYAIAIGHPYSMTIKVLKESKHLLKDVEPIFINELPIL